MNLLSKRTGSFCVDRNEELERWCEHFGPSFNQPEAADSETFSESRHSSSLDVAISFKFPNPEEIRIQLRNLKARKLAGEDDIY